MTIEEHGDITDTTDDLIYLARIMEYEKIDPGALDFNAKINSNAEDLLAILKTFNIICRNFISKNIIAAQESDIMPGHDLTSRLFKAIRFDLDGNHTELAYEVRPSIVKEIFYSLYTYLVMSAICGRIEECATCGKLSNCDNHNEYLDLMIALVKTYDYLEAEFKKMHGYESVIMPESQFDSTRVSGDVSHWVGLSLHWIYAGLQDGDDDKYRFQKNESLEIVCDIHVKEPMKKDPKIRRTE